jgi:hypothetical protein
MPRPLSDLPLQRTTLNLYEADYLWLKRRFGTGWQVEVRNILHTQIQRWKQTEEQFKHDK